MRSGRFKTISVSSGLGFGAGLLMAVPFWMALPRAIEKVWGIASTPACWFAQWCLSYLDFPGHGILSETGLLVCSAASVMQWTLFGFLVGLFRCLRLRGNVVPPADFRKAVPSTPPVK